MEMQVDDAPAITAYRAATPSLGDENAFHLLVSPRDRLADAALAAPVVAASAGPIAMELDEPVVTAVPHLSGAASARRAPGLSNQGLGSIRANSTARHERMFVDRPDASPPKDGPPRTRTEFGGVKTRCST